jgi:two-component system, sensor histidine kinase and response regulator
MEKNSTENENYSILIIDDVPKNIQLVAKFLTREGYMLYFAQSGETALKQIESKTFDLILLDVMMPGMDGFEVCQRINEMENSKDIPVIFLTAKTDDEAIAKGFQMGGVDYLTKPFNPTELIARVKTHLKLRQREKELKELNATKDTLLSVISHDLRTPFFNIMGLGELLLSNYEEYDEEMIKELITNMVDASRVTHNLLDNLLNWTRVQTGKIKYEPNYFDLEEVIKETLQLIGSQAKSKEVVCNYEISERCGVYADPNMIRAIFRNLLTNAIKYTSRGGSVTIKVKKINGFVRIDIIDTGVGMPEEKVKNLFSGSELISTPGTEQEPGTGFGLVLTSDFVSKNHGEISVTSIEGKGSTFTFTLPLSQDSLTQE